jgi:hypothetical protein
VQQNPLEELARLAREGGRTHRPGTSPNGPTVGATHVVNPAGAIYPYLQHPVFESLERLWRIEPEAGMFLPEVSPSKPFVFEIGGERVPNNTAWFIQAYDVSAGKMSGVAAMDTDPLEDERLSLCWGFDLLIQNARPRNCTFELDPVPIESSGSQYQKIPGDGRTTPDSYYKGAQSKTFGLASGAGLALLPFRKRRYGTPNGPFTIMLGPGQTIAMKCTIFRPIPVPLAYVGFDISGYVIPATLAEKYMQSVNP